MGAGLMAGTLGRLFLEIGLMNKPLVEGLATSGAEVETFEKKSTSSMANIGSAVAGLAVVGGAMALGVDSLKMAANFQTATTQLVTGAGETMGALEGVRKGLLGMAGEVGVSAAELAKGMYSIESAGFHGAAGLTVLRAAAEGAKVGAADMNVMADALTTTLKAYNLTEAQAVPVTNQMVAAVAAGKMHMGDFAGSLSTVLPIAAAAKVSIAEVFGAVATMTAQGMSAQQATHDLANTISQLQNPSQVAVKEMAQLGLQSNEVAINLGKKGLSGTLEELTTAITKHMGPAGTVLMDSFNQSKAAAADANTMLSKLPTSIQGIAHEFQNGTITAAAWRKDLKNLSPEQKALAQEFAHTELAAHSFNDLLKSGSPQAQTYNAALSAMLGGTTGLNTALMLGGDHAVTYRNNIAGVAEAASKGGKDVTGWALVQGDFNTKLEKFKAGAGALAITIGTQLLPAASRFMDVASNNLPKIVPAVQAIANAAVNLAPVIGAVAAGWVAWNIALAVQKGMAIISFMVEFAAGLATMVAHAGLATTAQWALNFAMDANPIGVIVVGIALLVGALVLLYQHVKPVRDAINWLWTEIQVLWHWIVGGSPGLVPAFQALMGIIGTVMNVALMPMRLEFQVLSAIVGKVWDIFKGFASFIGNVFTTMLHNITGPLGQVGDAINALNPFARHSPSLIDNVLAGTAAIRKAYSDLSGINIAAPRIGGATMPTMPATTGGAATWRAQQGGGGSGQSQGPADQSGTYIEKVEINNPRTELDVVRMIETQRYIATMQARGISPALRSMPARRMPA